MQNRPPNRHPSSNNQRYGNRGRNANPPSARRRIPPPAFVPSLDAQRAAKLNNSSNNNGGRSMRTSAKNENNSNKSAWSPLAPRRSRTSESNEKQRSLPAKSPTDFPDLQPPPPPPKPERSGALARFKQEPVVILQQQPPNTHRQQIAKKPTNIQVLRPNSWLLVSDPVDKTERLEFESIDKVVDDPKPSPPPPPTTPQLPPVETPKVEQEKPAEIAQEPVVAESIAVVELPPQPQQIPIAAATPYHHQQQQQQNQQLIDQHNQLQALLLAGLPPPPPPPPPPPQQPIHPIPPMLLAAAMASAQIQQPTIRSIVENMMSWMEQPPQPQPQPPPPPQFTAQQRLSMVQRDLINGLQDDRACIHYLLDVIQGARMSGTEASRQNAAIISSTIANLLSHMTLTNTNQPTTEFMNDHRNQRRRSPPLIHDDSSRTRVFRRGGGPEPIRRPPNNLTLAPPPPLQPPPQVLVHRNDRGRRTPNNDHFRREQQNRRRVTSEDFFDGNNRQHTFHRSRNYGSVGRRVNGCFGNPHVMENDQEIEAEQVFYSRNRPDRSSYNHHHHHQANLQRNPTIISGRRMTGFFDNNRNVCAVRPTIDILMDPLIGGANVNDSTGDKDYGRSTWQRRSHPHNRNLHEY